MISTNSPEELVEMVYEHRVQINKLQKQLKCKDELLLAVKAKTEQAQQTRQFRFIKRLSILSEIVQIINNENDSNN